MLEATDFFFNLNIKGNIGKSYNVLLFLKTGF